MRALVLIALAACGDNAGKPVDAPGPDAATGCTATFTGNFAETGVFATCAMVAAGMPDATLTFTVPTVTLGTSFAVTIDLGPAPSAGEYSSETVATWSARAVERVGDGPCLYNAGNTAVPHGSFDLELDALDVASNTSHGMLALTVYVLAFPSIACGTGDTEMLALRF